MQRFVTTNYAPEMGNINWAGVMLELSFMVTFIGSLWCVFVLRSSTNKGKLKAFYFTWFRSIYSMWMCVRERMRPRSRDKSERQCWQWQQLQRLHTAADNFSGSVLTLRNDNITCYEKLSVYVEKELGLSFFCVECACRFYRCFLRFDWIVISVSVSVSIHIKMFFVVLLYSISCIVKCSLLLLLSLLRCHCVSGSLHFV